MGCEIVRSKGAVFVLWGTPEAADMILVVETVEGTARDFGAPVVFIARVPASAPAPAGAAKQRANELLPRILAACSSYHVVLEGEGFLAAFKRGVLTSLLQPFWRQRMFFVHAQCADVRAKLLPRELAGADSILSLAERRGLTREA